MTRALSFAFGLVMVAAGALQSDLPALVASSVAVVAVLVGVRFMAAATVAVVATITALALSDPLPTSAAVAGLAAVFYLALRHVDAGVVLTRPTMLNAVGLSGVVLLAELVPLDLPWAPLAAPLVVLLSYVMVVIPYVGRVSPGVPLVASTSREAAWRG